jgi:hypothetical protein
MAKVFRGSTPTLVLSLWLPASSNHAPRPIPARNNCPQEWSHLTQRLLKCMLRRMDATSDPIFEKTRRLGNS